MPALQRFSRWIFPVLLLLALVFVGCSSEDTAGPPATPEFTADEIYEMIIEPQGEKDEVLDDLLTAGMDTSAALDSVLVLFLQDPAVEWGEVGDQGIAIAYTSGMVGGIFLDPQDHPEIEVDPDPLLPEYGPQRPEPSAPDGLKATPKKAIFLNPHYHERVRYADAIIETYGLRLGPAGYDDLEVYKNDEVTLDMYTKLTDHRIVHIYSHGWAWPNKENIQEVYLLSGEIWSAETYVKYWDEIEKGNIPLVRYHGGTDHFFVSPAFIYQYNNFDDEVLFYGGFCYSGLGSWPSLMVEDLGAGGYIGFDWSVLTSWNAAWNRNCMWNLLNSEVSPRINMNDWLTSSYPKYYVYGDRSVNVTYQGDQTFILFDEEERPCSETEQSHDDVWVHATAAVFYGETPAADVPVRFDYQKIHCDGHLGSIPAVYGETRYDGICSANTVASFHLSNTQDLIVVKATVYGVTKEKVFPFHVFNGMDGGSLFFPMPAEFSFHF